MHSLGIVQWNSTRRDHPGNPGRVSGSGPVNEPPGGFVVPQVEAPSDHCVCSLHSPVRVEHCFFLICLLCSYPNGA